MATRSCGEFIGNVNVSWEMSNGDPAVCDQILLDRGAAGFKQLPQALLYTLIVDHGTCSMNRNI